MTCVLVVHAGMNSHSPPVIVYGGNHNYGRFLSQVVDSDLYQTLRDIEILTIEDDSTDESQEVIERSQTLLAVARMVS
jgi:hypothetical protein